jgi:hypothetical protein
MRSPNMTPAGMREWRNSEAYAEYRRYRDAQRYDGYTDYVADRALEVIRGNASEYKREKVGGYIARHIKQSAGERRFGSGSDAVSAWTAALRNWGYDPTGKYT